MNIYIRVRIKIPLHRLDTQVFIYITKINRAFSQSCVYHMHGNIFRWCSFFFFCCVCVRVCMRWALVFNVNAIPQNDWQKKQAKQTMRREILVYELVALNLMLFDMVICSEIQRFCGDSQFSVGWSFSTSFLLLVTQIKQKMESATQFAIVLFTKEKKSVHDWCAPTK